MFKLNESVYDEVTEQLQKNLNKFASDNATENDKKLVEALELLNISAETLEQFGFEKEAEVISKLIIIAAKKKKPTKSKKDPATNGLTSEKMLSNLEHKGTVFNADDQNMVKDHKLPNHEMGMPLIYLTEKDNVLCADCATEVKNEGEKVTPHILEEGDQICEICSAPINAYYSLNDPVPYDDNNE